MTREHAYTQLSPPTIYMKMKKVVCYKCIESVRFKNLKRACILTGLSLLKKYHSEQVTDYMDLEHLVSKTEPALAL